MFSFLLDLLTALSLQIGTTLILINCTHQIVVRARVNNVLLETYFMDHPSILSLA